MSDDREDLIDRAAAAVNAATIAQMMAGAGIREADRARVRAVLAVLEGEGWSPPVVAPEHVADVAAPRRRLASCVAAWPEAETGAYDPRCCRFPKSCSADVYDEQRVTDVDLEP